MIKLVFEFIICIGNSLLVYFRFYHLLRNNCTKYFLFMGCFLLELGIILEMGRFR